MNLFKIFVKDDLPAVGLTGFREKKQDYTQTPPANYNFNRQIFTANYTKNFFLM